MFWLRAKTGVDAGLPKGPKLFCGVALKVKETGRLAPSPCGAASKRRRLLYAPLPPRVRPRLPLKTGGAEGFTPQYVSNDPALARARPGNASTPAKTIRALLYWEMDNQSKRETIRTSRVPVKRARAPSAGGRPK